MQAILEAVSSGNLPAEPRLVICNNSGAKALERARNAGIPALHMSTVTHPGEGELDDAMTSAMQAHAVEVVVMAGYMRKVGPRMLRTYHRRIVNIHPALLPRHGGQGMFGIHVHEAVIAAGEKETGATVHLADEEYDRGPILAQWRVPVLDGDTPETLQARVLETEHRLYPETLRRIALGEIELNAL